MTNFPLDTKLRATRNRQFEIYDITKVSLHITVSDRQQKQLRLRLTAQKLTTQHF